MTDFGHQSGQHHRAVGAALVALLAVVGSSVQSFADDDAAAKHFHERVEPILEEYCYSCHGYGESKGNHAFDEYKSDHELVGDVKLWLAALEKCACRGYAAAG